jgi:hypothetical protein
MQLSGDERKIEVEDHASEHSTKSSFLGRKENPLEDAEREDQLDEDGLLDLEKEAAVDNGKTYGKVDNGKTYGKATGNTAADSAVRRDSAEMRKMTITWGEIRRRMKEHADSMEKRRRRRNDHRGEELISNEEFYENINNLVCVENARVEENINNFVEWRMREKILQQKENARGGKQPNSSSTSSGSNSENANDRVQDSSQPVDSQIHLSLLELGRRLSQTDNQEPSASKKWTAAAALPLQIEICHRFGGEYCWMQCVPLQRNNEPTLKKNAADAYYDKLVSEKWAASREEAKKTVKSHEDYMVDFPQIAYDPTLDDCPAQDKFDSKAGICVDKDTRKRNNPFSGPHQHGGSLMVCPPGGAKPGGGGSNSDDDPDNNADGWTENFCEGSTDMHMDGFQWNLKTGTQCILSLLIIDTGSIHCSISNFFETHVQMPEMVSPIRCVSVL